jgi:CubicO group peptidase (beta-lactamase class C family)
MKQILALILSLILVQSIYTQTTLEFDFSSVEEEIQKAIDNKEIPSIVIAVAKNGNIIYEKAFGYADIKNQFKATTSTPYQLASVSKTFTATGIMLLNHQQKIDIMLPAEKYISPLKFNAIEGNASDVRVIDLLNHSSGLGTYFQLNYSDENVITDNFEAAFNKFGNLFHPSGLISEYSNLGYGLLDYIIEKQSGTTFSNFMKGELFHPLGLKNTFIEKADMKKGFIAQKYGANLKPLPEMDNNTKGAGNIYSSIHDLITFGMFNLKDNQKSILGAKDLDLMHSYINKKTIYHYYDSTFYGLGWYFKPNDNGYEVVWHEGGMMGVSSMIKLIPKEEIAIAVILNTSNRQYCQRITNLLNKIILPSYTPEAINEMAEYKPYTSDSTYFGNWKGIIKVGKVDIPCSLDIKPDGNIIIDYLDYTYKSYFTQNNPIPHKTILLNGLVNKNSFIGVYPGDLPSDDIRHEFSQLISMKLHKNDDVLSGTIVALAAAEREYYAYPYYIRLEKE